MMAFERWNVVTALFPFTDAPVKKPRPVVVLSGADFNRDHGHLIGCMITTGKGMSWPTDHSIVDLEPTGLTRPSVVRWKVFTLPFQVIGRKIGNLSSQDQKSVAARMVQVLVD